MPLTAWLHTAPDDAVPLHKQGDVVCVRLAGAPVSERERKEFVIVEDWDDTDLEAALLERKWTIGEPNPIIEYPYGAKRATLADDFTLTHELAAVSTVRVSITKLPDASDILDRSRKVAPKRMSDLEIVTVKSPAGTTADRELKRSEGA